VAAIGLESPAAKPNPATATLPDSNAPAMIRLT
jgi:hypothetical protein